MSRRDEAHGVSHFRLADLTWRARASYAAHAFKSVVFQHHRELLPVLRPLVPADGVIFDVGGHAGQFAKLFARLAPEGRVYTFEPGAYARSLLARTVSWHRLANVTLVPMALGDGEGNATLTVPLKPAGTHRFGLSHLGADAARGPTRREEVPVTTLNRFAALEGLRRLDFLKADIEGWELRMLEGGAETLRRFRPAMMIEMADAHLARAGDRLETAWRTLRDWGFRPFTADGGTGLRSLGTPREGDIFWLAEEN